MGTWFNSRKIDYSAKLQVWSLGGKWCTSAHELLFCCQNTKRFVQTPTSCFLDIFLKTYVTFSALYFHLILSTTERNLFYFFLISGYLWYMVYGESSTKEKHASVKRQSLDKTLRKKNKYCQGSDKAGNTTETRRGFIVGDNQLLSDRLCWLLNPQYSLSMGYFSYDTILSVQRLTSHVVIAAGMTHLAHVFVLLHCTGLILLLWLNWNYKIVTVVFD